MSDKPTQEPVSAQVYVTEASAGSGKTYALARRYMKLLFGQSPKNNQIPLKNILAITFTNKAAIEMKERILQFLKEIAFDSFDDPLKRQEMFEYLAVRPENARKKAFILMDEIIKNYNFFQVQTIDSFINAILSGCAFKLGLSAHFKIKRYYQDYIAYSLDKLIDKAALDNKIMSVFKDYLKQYLYLENKLGWFPKKDMLSVISQLFDDSNVYGASFSGYKLKDKDQNFKERRSIVALMRELADNEPEGANQVVFKSFRGKIEKFADALDVEELSKPFIGPEFPIRKNHVLPEKPRMLWAKIRKAISGLFELEALSLFNCYIDIFNLVYEDFQRTTGKEDLIFLSELNRKARLLFDEGKVTVPELYYRLAARFDHFLIDEFQDTSLLQWDNLFLMIEEAMSKGGTLFYVGDKKQAIFRFRGGTTSLFDDVQERLKAYKVEKDFLKDNYRSSKEIVEFNNLVFSAENLNRFFQNKEQRDKDRDDQLKLTQADKEYILSRFQGCSQNIKLKDFCGYVKIENIEIDNKEESDRSIREKLSELIKEIRSRYNDYKDITILCRTNSDIEAVTAWLIEEHIPVESEKTLNIKEHPLIKEIISFLKFLDSPIDNLSFASFITGDFFLKASGIPKERIIDFLFKVHDRPDKSGQALYLYREFRFAYKSTWDDYIEEFFRNVGFVPLYELVISILGRFKIPELSGDYQGFIMRFLELIKSQVNEENLGVSGFLEYFENAPSEDLYVSVAETDAVKIMSIHKAKGLGFRVVIIPFLEIDANIISRKNKKPYCVYPQGDYLKLLSLKKSYLGFSRKLEQIYRNEYTANLADELNSVYVAFTRAKNELYCYIPKKSSGSFNLANFLIPADLFERGKRRKPLKREVKPQDKMLLGVSQYKNWIPFLKEEFIDRSLVEQRDRVLLGEITHGCLSFVGNLEGFDKDKAVSDALKKGLYQFPFYEDFKKAAGIVEKIVKAQELKSFFEVKEGIVYREKEIVDRNGNAKRIDRLIVKKDEVLLIDYKSSRERIDDSRRQMMEYIEIVKELFPGIPAKGFLVFLDDSGLEQVDG